MFNTLGEAQIGKLYRYSIPSHSFATDALGSHILADLAVWFS